MPATDHREAIGVMEIRTTRPQRDSLLASIHQPRVHLIGCRRRPHAQNAVFRMQNHFAFQRHVIRDHGRNADAKIDEPAFRNVFSDTGGHLLTVKASHGLIPYSLFAQAHAGPRSMCNTRFTKMPGVWTFSGTISPSSRIWLTCAIVISAAMAITGLKFRPLDR